VDGIGLDRHAVICGPAGAEALGPAIAGQSAHRSALAQDGRMARGGGHAAGCAKRMDAIGQ